MAMNRFMGDSRIRNVYRGLAKKQGQRKQMSGQMNNVYQRMQRKPLQQKGRDLGAAYQGQAAQLGKMNAQKQAPRLPGQALQAKYRNRGTEQAGMNRAAPRLNSFQPQKKMQSAGANLQQAYSMQNASLAPRSE